MDIIKLLSYIQVRFALLVIDDELTIKMEACYASLVVQLKLPHYYQFMQSVSTNLTLR